MSARAVPGIVRTRPQDADHGRRDPGELDAAPDGGRIRTKRLTPELVRENRNGRAFVVVVLGNQRPAQVGAKAQHLEVVRRHEAAVNDSRFAEPDETERPVAIFDELIHGL